MAITLGNFSTLNGRTVLTGLSGSGLDTEGLIEGLTAARELPKVNLEDRIELNNSKIDAYSDLRTLLANLKDAANFLRNPPGVQNEADNVFKYRSATLTSNTSIAASNYMSVSAEPGASAQNYNVSEITSLATATKQKTGTFSIANADTSVVTTSGTIGFFKAGTMTVNGASITLADGDTLNQVVAKFNEVKSTTGIEASVIQAGTGSFVISFTATSQGTAAAFDLDSTGTVTSDTDGVLSMLGQTNLLTNGTFDSDISSWTDASNGTGSIAHSGSGSMNVVGAGSGNEGIARQSFATQIGRSYTVTLDLSGSTDVDINLGTSAGATDLVTQNFTTDGTVQVTFTATSTTSHLDIVNNDTGTLVVDNVSAVDNTVAGLTTTQTALDAVFIIDGVTITRAQNSITDVVDGLTFNLLQATPMSTTIDVDIAEDLSLPLSGASNFINAYNNLRIFVAEQTVSNDDGTFSEEAFLATESLLRSITSSLSSELSNAVDTVAASAPELVTNGTFDTDITGWTDASLGTGAIAYSSNTMQLTGGGAGGNEAFAQQAITTEVGKEYTVSVDFASLTNDAYVRIGSSSDVTSSSNYDIKNIQVEADGTATFTFTATGTTTYLTVNSDTNTTAFTVDNISVNETSATNLAEVGITFTDLPESDDNPFTRNILNIDEAKFNAALASSFTSVEQLFGFSSTSTNSNVAVFDTTNNTTATSFTIDIDPSTEKFQATVNSVTYDFTATSLGASGYSLAGPAGSPLEGMTLIYASTSAGTGTVTISQGIADRIYNVLDSTLDEQDGQLELAVDALEDTNQRLEDEIDRIEDQVERYRESLIAKFSALETLLSNVNTLLDSIAAQQAAIFSD